MKRFFATVTTRSDETGAAVLLDGRPIRTPAHQFLLVPTRPLAELLAAEWSAQGETIEPAAMPLTRLATTVVDLMPARRVDAIEEAAGFAATDLLCYRAAAPAALVARQARIWQPWLDWAERQFDAHLVATTGVAAVTQPPASLRALRRGVERLDDWRLVGLHAVATLTGSLVLALAVERGALTTTPAFDAALLEELYAIEQWGRDEEQSRRHAALRRDLDAAVRYLAALPC